MEQKQQVVSVDLAIALEKLGVKQDSLWWWVPIDDNVFEEPLLVLKVGIGFVTIEGMMIATHRINNKVSAFTVAEIGEILLGKIQVDKKGLCCETNLVISKNKDKWVLEYPLLCVDALQVEVKEADARGKLLIYLIENKLIDVGEL